MKLHRRVVALSFGVFRPCGPAAAGIRASLPAVACAEADAIVEFEFTGDVQTFQVPTDIGSSITVVAFGAQGATGPVGGQSTLGGEGGRGAEVTGVLPVYDPSLGTEYVIVVGGAGLGPLGGYNGGGAGGSELGGGGGGASDVRTVPGAAEDRLLVAAGGGGGGRAGCESEVAGVGGAGGGGGQPGAAGGDTPTVGGFSGGGAGGDGINPGAAGLGCGGFPGQAGVAGGAEAGGAGGDGQVCCCFSFGSIPGGGGGGGGFPGGEAAGEALPARPNAPATTRAQAAAAPVAPVSPGALRTASSEPRYAKETGWSGFGIRAVRTSSSTGSNRSDRGRSRVLPTGHEGRLKVRVEAAGRVAERFAMHRERGGRMRPRRGMQEDLG